MISRLENVLAKNRQQFHTVVDFNVATDKLLRLDFSEANKELTDDLITHTPVFSQYINKKLSEANAAYGIGGYNEDRVLYKRSEHFDCNEKRTIHLGIDIWGPAGTKVYTPVGGMVHSFAFNNHFGDYGATIILQHQLDTIVFHTLYGHASLKDIEQLHEGQYISRGEVLAHFGEPAENGDWPPHLHFQIIEDMRIKEGDYPGVCSISEREKYLLNCPDADLILNMMDKI
ncbi:MAG: peptidoglycan DD-metalloendopeptidase family protein [Chitinophagaceae bacterium]|nr:peptidoglycan DD-metalloendopeptidase family protein [Chitinophagaceae bacterium]